MSDSWRPKQSKLERLSRAQLSMTPGSAQGRIAQAQPHRDRRRSQAGTGETIEAIFSYSGAPTVGDESPPYFNRAANADLGTVIVSTRSNTTGSSTFQVLLSGDVVATVTLPSGEKTAELLVEDVAVGYGKLISVKATAVGGGLDGVTIQALLEEEN